MNKVKESTLSEITKKHYNDNIDKMNKAKKVILERSNEDMQRLYRHGMAVIDYRNGKLVRI